MHFGISTHLYHEQRLGRDHLAQVAGYGFEALEVFATRTHFDYHDPAAIEKLFPASAKLRMLNGSHSALAYIGLERGYEFVHQAIAEFGIEGIFWPEATKPVLRLSI